MESDHPFGERKAECANKSKLLICSIYSAIILIAIAIGFIILIVHVRTKYPAPDLWEKTIEMVEMRDGVNLYTEIYRPARKVPSELGVILVRTPYLFNASIGSALFNQDSFKELTQHGYYFIWQNVRGVGTSEGHFDPLPDTGVTSGVDDSTDAYDTIEWIKNNITSNGNVVLWGNGYSGYTALASLHKHHPNLAAVVAQSPVVDVFLDGVFFSNGAIKIASAFSYLYTLESTVNQTTFPYDTELYEWYKYFVPLANGRELLNYTDSYDLIMNNIKYNEVWEGKSLLRNTLTLDDIPTLIVGGWKDSDHLAGTLKFFDRLQKDNFSNIKLVLGPWFQHEWNDGMIAKRNETEMSISFVSSWLNQIVHKVGEVDKTLVHSYREGAEVWKNYTKEEWDLENHQLFYLNSDGSLDSILGTEECLSYTSDPKHPVPYANVPINDFIETFISDGTWRTSDQRFSNSRPDVLTYRTNPLEKAVTIKGNVQVSLKALSSSTDIDFVVKLIDVISDHDNVTANGFQKIVALGNLPARFRESFTTPKPLDTEKEFTIQIDLGSVDYKFLEGHEIMIHVQSTLFPFMARNTQNFDHPIPDSKWDDYETSIQCIYSNSFVRLPIVDDK